MEKYKVLIFPAAKRDLQEIIDYLNEQSSYDDFKLYDDISDQIASLGDLPFRCPLTKNSTLRLKGYRVLAVHSYLVFYVVKSDVVQIRRILHGKRHYDSLL
ncbi:type II toxin-antitoxin system RelE/ParE family toxin [Paenibacillus radicis (ex Xue et al. 2023)]|uniref:Type II toxin-antitoxin system RelE/ParE family toxin n=1 Tax=Paenibacillus radicis (ex Xue et al. 2023) TaxID=2972489 RepID=A0ABT1YT23_9BACL|nr:type II toxin-antitoxin system RelE/ParE family toxin [Paenibacillus radicis (ex Xue et al. 2023)]MCR8635443.1 type II toxin-antitoxin system RelE/ParE family toxin [Paenibacillus radicis (ex Xue et al. 2023)]